MFPQKNSQLFQEITTCLPQLRAELLQPTLKSTFKLQQHEVTLVLTQNTIFLFRELASFQPTHFLALNFDVKYQTIYQPIPNQTCLGLPMAIRLERQHCCQTLTFSVTHPSIAESWSLELEKKINQRNFHNLFKAKKKIGKGAFATVYLAERLRDHKMVAVKAFSKQKQYSGDKGKQSLENQISIMRKLNHQNISKLEGVYETQNSIYVILEYLEGKQLNEILKSHKRIGGNSVKLIIQNILKGLEHLSQDGIIHRDLKPENIIFKRENSCDVAICDFGLATRANEENYLFVRCGTPGFVAPEIINIKDMSTKSDSISDVFSAGVIFHYLLFGCSIFHGKKYQEILQQNRQCSFNFQKEMYGKIGGRALDLLTKMLEKDVSKRVSAAQALRHPYFYSDMDVEFESKILSRSSSLTSNYPFKIQEIDCETSVSRTKNQKYIVADFVQRQVKVGNYM